MLRFIKEVLAELRVSEDFGNDWYGYATNQLSHFVLGFTLTCLFSAAHFWAFDEFAQKGALWFAVGFVYAIWELGVQKWRGIDSLEDWIFFSVYGAGSAILFFNEIEPGNPELITSMTYVLPFLAVFYGHIAAGIFARLCLKVLKK